MVDSWSWKTTGPFMLQLCYIKVCLITVSLIFCSISLLQGLLEAVLFANIRFHDTISRGRLLNRFGKDFEGFTRLDVKRPQLNSSPLQELTAASPITLDGASFTVYLWLLLMALD
jgi:hypothetical protein